MLKKDVRIGGRYLAMISEQLVTVRIVSEESLRRMERAEREDRPRCPDPIGTKAPPGGDRVKTRTEVRTGNGRSTAILRNNLTQEEKGKTMKKTAKLRSDRALYAPPAQDWKPVKAEVAKKALRPHALRLLESGYSVLVNRGKATVRKVRKGAISRFEFSGEWNPAG